MGRDPDPNRRVPQEAPAPLVRHPLDPRAPAGSVDRAELHRLLDELFTLQEKCRRAGAGSPAERDKTELAERAWNIANLLGVRAAGWAINHIMGPALFLEEKDHIARRNLFAAWLERQAALLPYGLHYEMMDALRALDWGEVRPILKRRTRGKHGEAYSLSKLQDDALAYVEFLVGMDRPRHEAIGEVAAALAKSPATLNNWKARHAAPASLKDLLRHAKCAGALIKNADQVDTDVVIQDPTLLFTAEILGAPTYLAGLARSFRRHNSRKSASSKQT